MTFSSPYNGSSAYCMRAPFIQNKTKQKNKKTKKQKNKKTKKQKNKKTKKQKNKKTKKQKNKKTKKQKNRQKQKQKTTRQGLVFYLSVILYCTFSFACMFQCFAISLNWEDLCYITSNSKFQR